MKRIGFLGVFLFVVFFFAPKAFATAFSLAQTGAKAGLVGNSISQTCTLGSNPATGDTVTVGVIWYDGVSTGNNITVKDANNNVYTVDPNATSTAQATNFGITYIAYLVNAPANASKTITATATTTTGASGDFQIFCDDFTVTGGTVSLDNGVAGSAASGFSINTPTVTVSGSDDLLYSIAVPATHMNSVDSPWTQGGSGANGTDGSAVGYKMGATVNTAVAMTASNSGGGGWSSSALSLKFTATPANTPQIYGKGIGVSLYGPTTLYSGLTGWWTFDGKNLITNAKDTSGSGFNGNLTSFTSTSSAVVPGKMGQALSFNAIGNYVSVGAGPTSVQTVSFWMKVSTSTNQSIIDLNGTQKISASSGGTVSATGFGGTTVIYVDGLVSSTIEPVRWHLVTITTTSAFSASAMNIGRISTAYYGGILDDVRLYSRVLSAQEVFALYNATGGSSSVAKSQVGPQALNSSLVGWWTFDGKNLINNVTDSSGQGFNGGLTNFTSTSTAVLPGKMGQALSFNAIGNYVAIGTGPASVQTVSFWMKVATSTNERIIEYNASQTVSSSAGTISANSFGGTTIIYVDGVVASTIDTKWHQVTITTTSAFSASAMNIGKISTGYYGGILDDVRTYSRVLSAQEVTQLYLLGR